MKLTMTEFEVSLKNKVEAYLKNSNLSRFGGWRIYVKALVLLLCFAYLFTKLMFYPQTCGLTEKMLLGVNMALIGFCVMHDGSHGSFSKNRNLNTFAAKSIDIIGGISSFMWFIKHIPIHHTIPNTEDDDDIDSGNAFRMSKNQEVKPWHRYQWLYAIPAYGLLQLVWVFVTDLKKYFRRRIKNFPIKKITLGEHIYFWVGKGLHIFLFFVLPLLLGGKFWAVIGQYVIMSVTCGVLISIIFQLAHVVESSTFQKNTEDPQRSFMEHQLYETANFHPKNKILKKIFSWCVGGLDYQVEHHLFPKISHIHYPAIGPIIKEEALRNGYPYNEYTLWGAIKSHFRHLYKLRK